MNKISKRFEISCGIVVVRMENNNPLFLLLKAYDKWDLPKGHLKSGEDLLEAALRETDEETGIEEGDLSFTWGQVSKNTDVYKKGTKFVCFFIAETNKKDVVFGFNEELGRTEHDDYRWATLDEAKSMLNDRLEKIIDWANYIIGNKK